MPWARLIDTNTTVPDTQGMRMGTYNSIPSVYVQVNKTIPSDITPTALKFHDSIATWKRRIGCLTTPAPTDKGRAPPKGKRRQSAAAIQRWRTGGRQYPPWCHEEEVMMRTERGELVLPDADIKEALHMLPTGYTRGCGLDERQRCRMIANGWHVGAARFVITAALLFTSYEGTAASTIHRNPHPDGHRPLERAAQWFRRSQTEWRPPKTETDMNCTSFGEDIQQQRE